MRTQNDIPFRKEDSIRCLSGRVSSTSTAPLYGEPLTGCSTTTPTHATVFKKYFWRLWNCRAAKEVRNWPGLLRKVATRRALDRLRKRHCAASQHQSLERSPEPASANPGPVEHAEMNELISRLRQGVAKLPAMQAEVFCLRCFEEMSYQEIAEELKDRAEFGGRVAPPGSWASGRMAQGGAR